MDSRGRTLKTRKLRPDAIPSLLLGKNTEIRPAEVSSTPDPIPGTSFEIIPDVGLKMDTGETEITVESQGLDINTPGVVIPNPSSEPMSVDPPATSDIPVDPNVQLIEQLRAELDMHRKLRVQDQQKIAQLEKENAKLRLLTAGISEMKKLFSPEQIGKVILYT